MKPNNDLPKIDIADDFIIGRDINVDILNLYRDYPCRLKAEIFVFCLDGYLEASINLNEYQIKANDFVTLLPGSIIQIKKAEGSPKFFIIAYSSKFIATFNMIASTRETLQIIRENPVLHLSDKMVELFCDYFSLINKVYEQNLLPHIPVFYKNILHTIFYAVGEVYKHNDPTMKKPQNRGEEIGKNFELLVMEHYTKERSVSFYAKKLGITPQHLSSTIRQISGRKVSDIITRYVITDAKAQLKSTGASIQEIAYSLNFPNVSFFGKYFKRAVGVSPQQYRNS
ncbi:AraC family transcriptional regulator [Parabacteroides pacaensis]|uniref:AraC family transcriptional regulator n=1 Tax=Parabacteroides pacaensis TaxID=2086575 RepID=UPI000D10A159|nr:helix-turn-helix transcriptional regulator [Parabacteroides pacaensis]